jgi:hypothetical protein
MPPAVLALPPPMNIRTSVTSRLSGRIAATSMALNPASSVAPGGSGPRVAGFVFDVWGPAYTSETGYLRVHLTQLRRKLEPEPVRPRHLITEPGMGYRLELS